MFSAISDQLRELGIVANPEQGPARTKPELRNRGVQTPGPPAFPKVRKFTPKERSAASEAQSRAAKEAMAQTLEGRMMQQQRLSGSWTRQGPGMPLMELAVG